MCSFYMRCPALTAVYARKTHHASQAERASPLTHTCACTGTLVGVAEETEVSARRMAEAELVNSLAALTSPGIPEEGMTGLAGLVNTLLDPHQAWPPQAMASFSSSSSSNMMSMMSMRRLVPMKSLTSMPLKHMMHHMACMARL